MNDEQSNMPDEFDRLMGSLHGLPDVLSSKPSTIRTTVPILGKSQIWVVQTYRQRDQGDTVFVELLSGQQSLRIALPSRVADAIARQRDALTTKARRKAAKAEAERRKEEGIQPGFLKPKAV